VIEKYKKALEEVLMNLRMIEYPDISATDYNRALNDSIRIITEVLKGEK
jgi:hypothetical protein